MSFLHHTVIYLRVGYLLHLVTIGEILLIIYLFDATGFVGWLTTGFVFLKLILAGILISQPIFAQLDARSRYQNYKMLCDQFYLYGFQRRIVKPFAHSGCQRDAVRVAASQLGCLDLCNKYFCELGYRWYHLLPDFLTKKPVYLLDKKFWQTTFFVKNYKRRIDYKTGCLKKHELISMNAA